jgi:endonuclease/exonuclease/phosphatase family metal-dependent hydrolase
MQQEIRFATFNACNLALPGITFYPDQLPYSADTYAAKVAWTAEQLDRLDADVIGFQEIFSQAALRDVLARTTKYRDASVAGFDSADGSPFPHVALVSRLPLAAPAVQYVEFPQQLGIMLPGAATMTTRFARPVLCAQILVSEHFTVHVFVCHLKSKRPDIGSAAPDDDPDQADLGSLRSLFRRGAEGVGIRRLVSDCLHSYGAPVIVMGDFNDTADAVSTQLVMGSPARDGSGTRLFNSYAIQACNQPRLDPGPTHWRDGNFDTVDHILVSEHFHYASPAAIGDIAAVMHLNDHLALGTPEATDHGLVLVRVRLYPPTDEESTPPHTG